MKNLIRTVFPFLFPAAITTSDVLVRFTSVVDDLHRVADFQLDAAIEASDAAAAEEDRLRETIKSAEDRIAALNEVWDGCSKERDRALDAASKISRTFGLPG